MLLDVRELCSFCNYQLVLSGRSDRQVDAIADGISAGLKMEGLRPIGAEGARTGQWALLDYGDFVVHVFLHSAREHYDLEGLWNDAPRLPLDVPADARIPADATYERGLVKLTLAVVGRLKEAYFVDAEDGVPQAAAAVLHADRHRGQGRGGAARRAAGERAPLRVRRGGEAR